MRCEIRIVSTSGNRAHVQAIMHRRVRNLVLPVPCRAAGDFSSAIRSGMRCLLGLGDKRLWERRVWVLWGDGLHRGVHSQP